MSPCFYPLADVRWATLQVDPLRLAGCKKPYGIPIHKPHLFQIEGYVYAFCFGFEELLQLRYIHFPNSPAESEDGEPLVLGSLNLQHLASFICIARAVGKPLETHDFREPGSREIREFPKFGIPNVNEKALIRLEAVFIDFEGPDL